MFTPTPFWRHTSDSQAARLQRAGAQAIGILSSAFCALCSRGGAAPLVPLPFWVLRVFGSVGSVGHSLALMPRRPPSGHPLNTEWGAPGVLRPPQPLAPTQKPEPRTRTQNQETKGEVPHYFQRKCALGPHTCTPPPPAPTRRRAASSSTPTRAAPSQQRAAHPQQVSPQRHGASSCAPWLDGRLFACARALPHTPLHSAAPGGTQ